VTADELGGPWKKLGMEEGGREKREEKRHPTDMWGPTYNSF
jgi:hypothetical protein